MLWSRPRVVFWTVLCALFLGFFEPPLAQAATDKERAAARALAGDGARAFQSKEYESAVDLFTRAEALIHSPVHLLFLARSHRALGQLVKAREAYIKITRERLEPGAPKVFFDAQRDASAELEEVEPRLASLTILVKGVSPEQARVTLDGEAIPPVLVGVPMPMDPGDHQLVASAAGAEDQTRSLTLAEGQKESLTFELVVTNPPEADPTTEPSKGQPTADEAPKESSANVQKIIGWTAIGLGVGGAAYAGYLAIDASDLQADANADAATCAPECTGDFGASILKRDAQAADMKTQAAVIASVSGAVVLTGVILLATANSSNDSAGLTPWVGWQSAGVSGRF